MTGEDKKKNPFDGFLKTRLSAALVVLVLLIIGTVTVVHYVSVPYSKMEVAEFIDQVRLDRVKSASVVQLSQGWEITALMNNSSQVKVTGKGKMEKDLVNQFLDHNVNFDVKMRGKD